MDKTSESRDGNFQNALQKLGLNQKESDVYFTLLTIGSGTVSEIAKRAGINRTTGYDILASLTSKGIISISGKEPKQEYRCESPDKILLFLKRDIERKQEDYRYAELIIPELKSMHKVGSRPRIRFYEGIEGLKQVYEDTLTAKEKIVAYASYENMHDTLKGYFPNYYKRRAAAGVSIKGIVAETSLSIERAKHNKAEARELAIVPLEKFNISPEIDIYDNKVMIASWREKLGIIIESAEIADAMKKIFELSWARAKELDKELRSKK